jgi:formate dehydrogenase subunit beta
MSCVSLEERSMAKSVTLAVNEGGIVKTLQQIFKDLLEKKLVEALLVPLELPSKENVVQSLVASPGALDAANPLAPVLPVNTANIVSKMTKVAPSEKKVAVIARSCELRALTELVKLKQASLDNIVLIGIDCFGAFSVPDYGKFAKESSSPAEDFLNTVKDDKSDDSRLREACQSCEYPYPLNADIVIGLIGADFDKEALLTANTPEGESILEGLGLPEASGADARDAAIQKVVAEKTKKRDELFELTQKECYGLENLGIILAPCIGCHNCRDMCPICYCKECVFDSPTFAFEADKYIGWAERKGAIRMPTDTFLFHLTRLNHMVTSCVGCGLCQEACPNDVPVFRIFRLVGSKVQPTFDYVPGRDVEEPLPLTAYKEEELEKVGYE